MKKINPFYEEKAIPVDGTFKELKNLCLKPYNKASGRVGYTNEWADKAGGYAIQGTFAKHVKRINGDYYNVVGLPISRLYRELKKVTD